MIMLVVIALLTLRGRLLIKIFSHKSVRDANFSEPLALNLVTQFKVEISSILASMRLNRMESILKSPLFTLFDNSCANAFSLKIWVHTHLS